MTAGSEAAGVAVLLRPRPDPAGEEPSRDGAWATGRGHRTEQPGVRPASARRAVRGCAGGRLSPVQAASPRENLLPEAATDAAAASGVSPAPTIRPTSWSSKQRSAS